MLNTGLFTYPVLQAADILVYKSVHTTVHLDDGDLIFLSLEQPMFQ